jgi:hypothetical protein
VRWHRREKPHYFVGAQDNRQQLLLARVGDALDHRGPSQSDAVEERSAETATLKPAHDAPVSTGSIW